MKYQNANNYFFPRLSALTLFCTFMAQARIENTVIVNYDLNSGKSVHYELITSPLNKNTTVTLVPLEQSNKTPSTFKIAACINHYTGTSKQGVVCDRTQPAYVVDSFRRAAKFAFYTGCRRSVNHRPLYFYFLNKSMPSGLA